MSTRSFPLDDDEQAKAAGFEYEHEKRHGRSKAADGARYTYSFTPSGIGTTIIVKCNCGEQLDVTNYESW